MNAQHFLSELKNEFISTQKLLDRVPEDQLNFQPHEKAMFLGQLALHVASIPERNLGFAKEGQVEASVIVQHPIPNSKTEILTAFSRSKKAVVSLLEEAKADVWINSDWKLLNSGSTLAEMPTKVFIRTFVINHFIHHRGELATYLRTIGEKIPSIYGPSADENPFQ